MKKRLVSLFLAVIFTVAVLPGASLAAGSLSNFTKTNTYSGGQFADVSNQWFASYVQTVYEYGLMNGTSPTSFSPEKSLSIAEAIKLAACLHSIFNTGTVDFSGGSPWYQPYVDYALANGILKTPYPDYTADATRSDFAMIFANALPEEALTAINKIPDNTIPDVSAGDAWGSAVYKLYRAGILAGSDSAGTFYPGSSITRDAVAAIVTRMAIPTYRQKILLGAELSAADIASKCASAVFYIEAYDLYGKLLSNGSGFFISSSGLAVTNFHVVDGAASAKIETHDGKIYDVSGIFDFSGTNDLALLQINGTGFSYLNLGNSDSAATGATIYAVGYPLGIDQTFAKGTITNASHPVGGVNCIMIDASISEGSSGGALINSFGQVIGVTTFIYDDSGHLNVAVPVKLLHSLKQTACVPMNLAPYASGAQIKATPSTVTVTAGSTTSIAIADVKGIADGVEALPTDAAVASCSFGSWKNSTITLNIKGLKAGTTTITAYLLDSDKRILTATTITVTVNDVSAPSGGSPPGGSPVGTTRSGYPVVPDYPGYPTVPDFGSFAGAPIYKSTTDNTGICTMFYRVSDITIGDTYSVLSYMIILNDHGYKSDGSVKNGQGFTHLMYINDKYLVSFGQAYYGSVLCEMILIIPVV